jgi:predicted Rossmann fold nucleotide-binding protein DprA/Smf involved in DNA uptake
MTYPTPESRLVAVLCTPIASVEQDVSTRPLSPRQWFIINERLKALEGVDSNDGAHPEWSGAPTRFANFIDTMSLPEVDVLQIKKRLDLADAVEAELDRLQELGIWILTITDPDYPNRLRENLPIQAPPVLFGFGNPKALDFGGLAVVGPRNSQDSDLLFAKEVGEQCASERIPVISGAAKGIDRYAMMGALEHGGNTLGVLGDSLEKQSTNPETQSYVESGQLTLISPYHPKSHFEVGKAMGRNKLIYALADWALVVSCQVGQGGTWHGATSAMKSLNIPVLVRTDTDSSPGNTELLKRGALEFPAPPWNNLVESLTTLSVNYLPKKSIFNDQAGLFDNEE